MHPVLNVRSLFRFVADLLLLVPAARKNLGEDIAEAGTSARAARVRTRTSVLKV
jgi:hypothetical protein